MHNKRQAKLLAGINDDENILLKLHVQAPMTTPHLFGDSTS